MTNPPHEINASKKENESNPDGIPEFHDWLKEQYPYLQVRSNCLDQKFLNFTAAVSNALYIVLATIIIGSLSKFRVVNAAQAGWFLAWLYLPPVGGFALTLCVILGHYRGTVFKSFQACITLLVYLAMIGGTAVYLTGLMESMCDSVWLFPPRVWVAIGFVTATVVLTLAAVMLILFLFWVL
jgi:hypothetical protein